MILISGSLLWLFIKFIRISTIATFSFIFYILICRLILLSGVLHGRSSSVYILNHMMTLTTFFIIILGFELETSIFV